MSGRLKIRVLMLGLVVLLGCHHDKYHIKPKKVEEYAIPPDETRYNLPDTAGYKKPPPEKDDKTLFGKQGGPGGKSPGPGGLGGF